MIWRLTTWGNVKSTFEQRCVCQRWNLQRPTTSNQRFWIHFYADMNVQKTLSFSTSSFTNLSNVETTLWKWPFPKGRKKLISNWMHWIQSFNYCFILFTLLAISRGTWWRIPAKPQKFFKSLYFVKHQLYFNFTRRLVQVRHDLQSFNLRVTVNVYVLNALENGIYWII